MEILFLLVVTFLFFFPLQKCKWLSLLKVAGKTFLCLLPLLMSLKWQAFIFNFLSKTLIAKSIFIR